MNKNLKFKLVPVREKKSFKEQAKEILSCITLKLIGTVICLSSYSTALLTLFKAKFESAEKFTSFVKGYNLMEFSAWGCLVYTMPLLVTGIAYSKIKNKWKNILLILSYPISVISAYNGSTAAHDWLRENATGYVLYRPYMLIFAFLMLVGIGCLFTYFNKYPENDI